MKTLKLTLATSLLFQVLSARAQVLFQYPQLAPISVSDEEVAALGSASKASDKGFRVSNDILHKLPVDLSAKLLNLSSQDLFYKQNDEYELFMRYMGINERQAQQLRHQFVNDTAKAIITNLKAKPHSVVRVLARDLNEVYGQIEFLLRPEGTELGLSSQEKFDIISRIALVPASRPIVDALLKAPNAEKETLSLFQLTSTMIANNEVILLDSGYEGSIAIKLYDVFKGGIESGKVKWNFIWRAPNAPAFIQRFEIPKLETYLKAKGWFEKFYMADKPYSFRVAMIEHFPKWTGRAMSWKSDPVVLMLDLDDTVLKEVDIQDHRQHEKVQILKYLPNEKTAQKYRERLNSGIKDPSKVVHFEFEGNYLKSSVTTRPAIEVFLKSILPLVKTGKLKLLVTSNNDFSRTQAVFEQLKISGQTLKEMGAQVVEPRLFNDAQFKKDMGMLRQNLHISAGSTVIAIDDLPQNYVRSSVLDEVEGVTAFAGDYVQKVLQGQATNLDVQDSIQLARLREAIFKALIETEPATALQKVRAAYMERGLQDFVSSGGLDGVSCQSILGVAR